MSSQPELARIRSVYHKRFAEGSFERYTLFSPGELFMLQQREYHMLRLLRRHGFHAIKGKKILDVGCGRGLRLLDWLRWGASVQDLYGIDLMPELIEEAKHNLPAAQLVVGSADRLEFSDGMFDIVVQNTLFTSILEPALKQAIAAEMLRVVKKDGIIIWYDFRYPNPKNPDVKPISAKELAALFPQRRIILHPVTLLPPLARRLAPLSFTLCRLLQFSPPLRSHYLALIEP